MRRSAIVFAGLALAGVLALGVLQGLVVTAGLTLVYVLLHLSQRSVSRLAPDADARWVRGDGDTGDALVLRPEGILLYPNDNTVSDRVLDLLAGADPRPRLVVLDLSLSADLDVQSADMLGTLAREVARAGAELRLAGVHRPARAVLTRAGVAEHVVVAGTIDDALR